MSNHMTLGNLIDGLWKVDQFKPVFVNHRAVIVDPHSYRGYYEHLSFDTQEWGFISAIDLIEVLEGCLYETFTGWKGGEYSMTSNTPVWFSPEGCVSGLYPTSIEEFEHHVIINTDKEVF